MTNGCESENIGPLGLSCSNEAMNLSTVMKSVDCVVVMHAVADHKPEERLSALT